MLRTTARLAALAVLLAACSGAPEEAVQTPVPSVVSSTSSPTGTTAPAPTTAPTSPMPSAPVDGGSSSTPTPLPLSEATTFVGPSAMPALHPSVDGYPEGRAHISLDDGTSWDIPVLLATTAGDRAHGLMEVPDVPAATGMAFVFERDGSGGFWMKGTETDLDIAWFRADGIVVAITTMEVCRQQSCPSYFPGDTYRYALEVRAGWFATIGLEVGDRIGLVDADGDTPTGR